MCQQIFCLKLCKLKNDRYTSVEQSKNIAMCTFNLRKYSKYYINENALSLWGPGLQIMKCTSNSQQNEIAVSRSMHRIAGF